MSAVLIEKISFLFVGFTGITLFVHTVLIKVFQDTFFVSYLNASTVSGAVVLTALYIFAKFNKGFEGIIMNFLRVRTKNYYKLLLREAITDGLTGLYDHKYFKFKLGEELTRARRYLRPFGLLMIDIDHFKEYNDSFGHIEGDAVLVKLSNVFKQVSRISDMAFRYGGEEFALILPETGKRGSLALAEKLRRQVESLKFKNDKSVTISVGISCFDGYGSTLNMEGFIRVADGALYKAKASGRNRVEI